MWVKNFILACILMFPVTSYAYERRDADAEKDTYLALAVGSAAMEEDGFKNSPAFKLSVGKNIGNFAYEISFLKMNSFPAEDGLLNDFSDFLGVTVGSIDIIIEGFDISVFGILPLNDRFSVQGRAGVFFWDATFIASFPEFLDTDSFTDDGNDTAFGVGLNAALSEQISLTFMYDQYKAFASDIELLSAAIKLGF